MQPLRQSLRLNPKADAEALAHVGLLIPSAPEAIISAELKIEPIAPSSTAPQQLHGVLLDDNQPAPNPLPSGPVTHDSKPAAAANAVQEDDLGDGQSKQVRHAGDLHHATNATAQVVSSAKASATQEAAAMGSDVAEDVIMTDATTEADPFDKSIPTDRQAVARSSGQ